MLCCLFWFVRAAGRKCVFYCFAFSSLFSHSVATWRFAFRFTFYLSGTGWGTKQIYLRASEEMPLAKGRAAPTVRCEIDCKVWPFHHYNYFTNTNKYICMYAMQRCKCISLFLFAFFWHVSLVLVVILVVCTDGASRCTCVWGGEAPCMRACWHFFCGMGWCVYARDGGAYSIKTVYFYTENRNGTAARAAKR